MINAVCKKFGINYNKTEWVYDVSEDKNMGYLRGEFEEKAGEVVDIQLFFKKVGESGTLAPDDSDCVGLKKEAFFGVYL